MDIVTASPEETRLLGRQLGAACRGGEVIVLEGDLGAGKTTLAQGLASGLGVAVPVVSPTFVVLREYVGRVPLYHFDFYRMEGTERALDLEFEEYLAADGVCVIEWPTYAPRLIPASYLRIALRIESEDTRTATVEAVDPGSGSGSAYASLLVALQPGEPSRGAAT